jgi:hypothetical protein
MGSADDQPREAAILTLIPRHGGALLLAVGLMGPISGFACTPYIEEFASQNTAMLRPHRTAFEACTVDQATYRRLVSEWLRSRAPDAPRLSSLGLGRAVSSPWISRRIAGAVLKRPGWERDMKRARPDQRQRLAAPAFADPELLHELAAPFEDSPYRVTGISFEKVLFGKAADHTTGGAGGHVLVPFDAQLWLRLAPR